MRRPSARPPPERAPHSRAPLVHNAPTRTLFAAFGCVKKGCQSDHTPPCYAPAGSTFEMVQVRVTKHDGFAHVVMCKCVLSHPLPSRLLPYLSSREGATDARRQRARELDGRCVLGHDG
jgi:hypothetical protein